MKNHFKVEVWIVWLLLLVPVLVAVVAAVIWPLVKSRH